MSKKLEILLSGSEDPERLLLIWPSTGGNARSFRIKDSELSENKITLVRYNPKSHGDSEGIYNPSTAGDDIIFYLEDRKLSHLPIIGIGHSGGGAGLIRLSSRLNFTHLFLLSPILDSRLSLFYLYENDNIREFLDLLQTDPNAGILESDEILRNNETIYHLLETSSWLNTKDLFGLKFPIHNSRVKFSDLSVFLKNLFLPGFEITKQHIRAEVQIRIFLPKEDHWFPKDRTIRFAEESGIRIVHVPTAPDHFFTSSWMTVWSQIRSEIFR